MKAFVIGCALTFAIGGAAIAQTNSNDHYVRGHATTSGTYVEPHWQTNPNSTTSDNYSTRGNTNPHTGQAGTKPPY